MCKLLETATSEFQPEAFIVEARGRHAERRFGAIRQLAINLGCNICEQMSMGIVSGSMTYPVVIEGFEQLVQNELRDTTIKVNGRSVTWKKK